MKCAYARVSSISEEQEHSLIFQTQYYKALIESQKDSEFVGIYADTKSGKTSRLRKQFKAMLQAARRGEIDFIITKSIARFARNLIETLKIIRELREIGIGIFFEKESIDTLDYKSDFMISIYSLVAESEVHFDKLMFSIWCFSTSSFIYFRFQYTAIGIFHYYIWW